MITDDEQDNEYVDLYDLGWHDGFSKKQVDQDYCASEEYMAGYIHGTREQQRNDAK